jgi:hypothetical protein
MMFLACAASALLVFSPLNSDAFATLQLGVKQIKGSHVLNAHGESDAFQQQKANTVNTRRNFFQGAAVAVGTVGLSFVIPPQFRESYAAVADGGVDYKAVSADIADAIKKNPDW